MVVRRRKKSRKLRGKSTGRGNGKRARGAGNRGGRGKAGIGKRGGHKKLIFMKMGVNLSQKGFTSIKQKHKLKSDFIDVGLLDKLIEKLISSGLASETKEGIKIDLRKLGFKKLLGSGKVKNKLIIHVESATENAKQKVENAGGKIVV